MVSEQFSLCWDNFHKNICGGMQLLLENEDFVDVTLAVEGQYLKAHKMVLSLCSPYFRELFQSNPCKHPIVFMKDVSYIVLNDLLQFMYQGEVQVSQENLPTFIKTAEALQIKGLTGDNKYAESASKLLTITSTPTVMKPEAGSSSNACENDIVQIKSEPFEDISEHTQVENINESHDTNFLDDSMDNEHDDSEDYYAMETITDEPVAGTSADNAGNSQVLAPDDVPNKKKVTKKDYRSLKRGREIKEHKKPLTTSVDEILPRKKIKIVSSADEKLTSLRNLLKEITKTNYTESDEAELKPETVPRTSFEKEVLQNLEMIQEQQQEIITQGRNITAQNNDILQALAQRNALDEEHMLSHSLPQPIAGFPMCTEQEFMIFESDEGKDQRRMLYNHLITLEATKLREFVSCALKTTMSDELVFKCSWLGGEHSLKLGDTEVSNLLYRAARHCSHFKGPADKNELKLEILEVLRATKQRYRRSVKKLTNREGVEWQPKEDFDNFNGGDDEESYNIII